MAELTPQQLQQFQKDLEKLNTLKRQLGEKPIKIGASVDNLNLLTDALERAEDLVDNLNDGAKGLATSWRNVVGEIKKTNEGYRLGMGSLNKLKDIADKLRLNQKGISELSSADLRSLQRKQQAETENLKLARQILSEKIKSGKYTDEEYATYANINNQLNLNNSALKQQNELLAIQEKRTRNIERGTGLTGAALKGLQGITNKLGLSGLSQAFEDANDAAKNTVSRLTDGGKKSAGLITKTKALGSAFKVVGKEIIKNLADPLVVGGIVFKAIKGVFNFIKSFITGGFEKGKTAAERISEENVNVARTLGLAQGAASKLASSVAGIGPTVAASKEAVTSLYSALGSTEKLSTSTLKVFVKLSTYAGMSAESLAHIQKFAKLSGQDAGVLVTNMAQTALETIKTNKYAFSQKSLLNDVANVSSVIRLRFKDQPKALVESVAKAKALGIEMNKIEDIASNLLNFEDSIAAEMEAELLTGRQLNLEKAREAALAGDTVALQNEIASQLGSIEEFNKMNVIQQDAFAKSIGLSRGELAGMLDAQKSNLSTQGDLVDQQTDGIKAMSSGQSEAERNAERRRRGEEASIPIYKSLIGLVEILENTWNKVKFQISESISEKLIKPFVDWVNSDAGKKFIDELPERAKKFSDSMIEGAKAIGEAVLKLGNFIKEHPWLSTIATVSTGAVVKGLSALGALKGATPMTAIWVRMAGMPGMPGKPGVPGSKSKPSGPLTKSGRPDMRYKANRVPQSSSTPAGGGGGGFFSNIGKKISNSSIGQIGSKAFSSVKNLGSRALGGIKSVAEFAAAKGGNIAGWFKANTKKVLPKILKSSKGALGGILKKIPFVGGVIEAISAGMDIDELAKSQNMSKSEIYSQMGKRIIGGGLGVILGSIAAALVSSLQAVGIPGWLLSTIAFAGGDWLGRTLGDAISDHVGGPSLGKAIFNTFYSPKGADSAEDFILQNGKMTKFRKDDLIIGGTKLDQGVKGNTGSSSESSNNAQMIELLKRLVAATEKGGIVMLDGQKVGTALNVASYRMQ